MSTIFNVFNNMNSHKQFLTGEHLKERKLAEQTSGAVPKKFEQCRPKGLSLRSKSDINIPANSYSIPIKKDCSNDSFFSGSEFFNKQSLQIPKEFIKTESSEMNKEKVLQENIFKKPFEIKEINEDMFPEPEVLAPYYDPHQELDDIYSMPLQNEFLCLLNLQDDVDEGFGTDPEELSYPEISTLDLSSNFYDHEYTNYGSPELPEISDDENF